MTPSCHALCEEKTGLCLCPAWLGNLEVPVQCAFVLWSLHLFCWSLAGIVAIFLKMKSFGALILCLCDISLFSLIQVGFQLVKAVLDGQSGGSRRQCISTNRAACSGHREPACRYPLQRDHFKRKLGFGVALLGQGGLNNHPPNSLAHHPSTLRLQWHQVRLGNTPCNLGKCSVSQTPGVSDARWLRYQLGKRHESDHFCQLLGVIYECAI